MALLTQFLLQFPKFGRSRLSRECKMGTFKASGPGGQHRNKRESAVRLKHIPTGVIAQDEGSVSEAAKFWLSKGVLSQLIPSDASLRMTVNELRTSKA